jgi:hypothetical protein
MFDPVYMVCDSANVDATTGVCSAPYWATAPTLLPPLDATGGMEIGVAILGAWATAWLFRSLLRSLL